MKVVIRKKKNQKTLAKKVETKATARKTPSKVTTKKQTAKAKTTSNAVKAKPVKTKKAEAKNNRSSASENIPLGQAMRSFLGLPTPKASVPAVGSHLKGRIVSAHVEGIAVALEDGWGRGLVSARSIGKTVSEREAVVATLKKDGPINVVVVGYNEKNRRVVLGLPNDRTVTPAANAAASDVAAEEGDKPRRLIVDAANYLGALMENYVDNDEAVGAAMPMLTDLLLARNIKPVFFVESKFLKFLEKKRPAAYDVVKRFIAESGRCVMTTAKVRCDEDMLQLMRRDPATYILSRDRFKEYSICEAETKRVIGFTAITAKDTPSTMIISRLGLTFDLDTGSKSEGGRPKAIEVLSDRGVSLMLQRPVGSEILEHLDGAFVHSFVNDFRGTSWDCFAYASAADLPNGPEGLDVEQLDIKDYLDELKKGTAQ